MPLWMFAFFAALAIVSALGVIFQRNVVHCLLSLVLTLLVIAVLFIGEDAIVVGFLQAIVYGGAIMVLFLFVIWLLNLPVGARAGRASGAEAVRLARGGGAARGAVHLPGAAASAGEIQRASRRLRLDGEPRDDAVRRIHGRVRGDLGAAARGGGRSGRDRAAHGRAAGEVDAGDQVGAVWGVGTACDARRCGAAMIPLTYMMSLSAALFAIGVLGVIIRRNVLVMFMSIELMLNAVNLTFIALSSRLGSMDGQVIVFFVMTIAAAEAAVGLAIIIAVFRGRDTLHADELTLLKW